MDREALLGGLLQRTRTRGWIGYMRVWRRGLLAQWVRYCRGVGAAGGDGGGGGRQRLEPGGGLPVAGTVDEEGGG